MIDFRYHLVSLVSVFLALALGIVLGAGPLSGPIGDALTSEVDKIREERTALQAELDETRAGINSRNVFIDALGPQLVTDVLKDVPVALIQLPEASGEDVLKISSKIQEAGGKVVADVKITANWFSSDKEQFRRAVSSQIVGYLNNVPAAGASGDQILATALGQILSLKADETLIGILSAKTDALISIEAPIGEMARAFVVIGPRSAPVKVKSGGKSDSIDKAQLDRYVTLTESLARVQSGTIIVGSANQESDIVAYMRGKGAGVSTVDAVGTSPSYMIVPGALANSINGILGAWGLETGASAPLPPKPAPVALPAAAQTPAVPPAPETQEPANNDVAQNPPVAGE